MRNIYCNLLTISFLMYHFGNLLQIRVNDIELNVTRFGNINGFLLRWIRDKGHNVAAAENAIRKYMDHRCNYELDTIHAWNPKIIVDELPFEFCGFDDNDCPNYYVPFGKYDLGKLIDLGLGFEYKKRIIQLYELADRKIIPQKRDDSYNNFVPGFNLLIDLSGFEFKSVMSRTAISIILEITKLVDAFHAPGAHYIYMCNAPKSFSCLWKLINPLIRAELRDKILFFSNNSKLQARLESDNIPKSIIPKQLGGEYLLSYESKEIN